MTYKVSRKRSLIKTFTWRCIASIDTFLIVLLITREITWAGSVATLEILTKCILFYLHERGWNYITWGKYENGNIRPWWFKRFLNKKKKAQ